MNLGGEQLDSDSVKNTSEVEVDNNDLVEAVVIGNDVDSCGVNERVGDLVNSRDLVDEGNKTEEHLCSPGVNSASPSGSRGSTPKKGYGLKKWKRYRREGVVIRVSPSLDTGKVLKRGVSGINDPLSQSPKLAEEEQGAGDFVQPINSLDNNLGGLSYFPAQASSSIVFAMGAVTENSEDRSSKSSTAASAPRHGIGMASGSPISVDKKKPNNRSGKGFNNSNQMGQLGKGRADPSKKLRGGERVRYEKEISQSSLESDSRSSNFVFIQTTNRRQSEASVNYNEESDDDVHVLPHFTDDLTTYSQENARETEDISPHDGHHQSPTRRDPLADSIGTLDSVREAVKKELQKFKEIGKEIYFTSGDTGMNLNSSEYLNGDDVAQNANGSLNLPEKITYRESTLEEAIDSLRIKELRVGELEAKLQSACLLNGDTNNKTQGQELTKMVEELEFLFAQKVEADVKYIIAAVALLAANALLAEQTAVAEEPEQTECQFGKIKRQAKELETLSADIVDSLDAEHVKRRISKLTWYSLSQLLMLLVALWAVYLRPISDSGVVVPT